MGHYLFSVASAQRALRHRALKDILRDIKDSRGRSTGGPGRLPLERLVATFAGVRRWIPVAPRCLPDSLALLSFLSQHCHHPRLVFGVVPTPFAAHCWLQTNDHVLNDAGSHARQFAPILVV